MRTVLESVGRSVVIARDEPFVLIGERINPTGRKRLAAELAAGAMDLVRRDAEEQVRAGAHVLDVNAGVPGIDEPATLAAAVRAVSEVVDVPICIDSSVVEALEAALDAYPGKALVNSVTAEEERLERVLPVVKRHGAAVVGIANDENGIPMDPEARLALARRIVERAADHGIPVEDVVIDPIAMTVGADPAVGAGTLETIRLVRRELGSNLTCGASNVSFGLPARPQLNAAFLAMAAAAGMTSAITNPLVREVRIAVRAADALLGRDAYGLEWIRYFREATDLSAVGRG